MELTIVIQDPQHRAALFGAADAHLRLIRSALGVYVSARDSSIKLSGEAASVGRAAAVLEALQQRLRHGEPLQSDDITAAINEALTPRHDNGDLIDVYTSNHSVAPRTEGQKVYLQAIRDNDMTFCLGPAGTGKTYLAVAVAVSMLKARRIKRVVLARPAVEAGEKLGYLPGDLQAKVNPYLRPLFDAMNDMMSFDQVRRFMENDVVEVIPLAFMRGRTLNHAAILLDEAQNSTVSQMLMFLTRLGHESKMIITGDDSQVDLEKGQTSGLFDAVRRLNGVPGIGIIRLNQEDIVRHPLVNRVVEAYGRGRQANPKRDEA